MSFNTTESLSSATPKKSYDCIEEESNSDNSDNVPLCKFLDSDSESDETIITIPKKKSEKKHQLTKISRPLTDYMFASVKNYSFKTWSEFFPNKKVILRSLLFNPSWNDFFDIVEKKPYYSGIERILSDYLTKSKERIVPDPELLFNALNLISPKNIKNVIIGQDPYPGVNKIGEKLIPQAMGFSFSVPFGYQKPPSLSNIYNNMKEFGHIKNIPDTGCLTGWILQGCFMINASLTTFEGKKNAHKKIWVDFTNDLLSYVNNNCKNVTIMVWGKDAHNLCLNMDPYKHYIITSSHPSPLGFEKSFSGSTYGGGSKKTVQYKPFKTTDHFGMSNEYLKSVGKKEIVYDFFY